MKNSILIFIICLLFSCKKKDINLIPSELPISIITDSAFQITNIIKTGLNEFDIKYFLKPPPNEQFSNTYMIWSTDQNFVINNDSLPISASQTQLSTFHLSGLNQSSRYFTRIGLNYNNKRLYSQSKVCISDSFKIINVGNGRGLNKVDTAVALTNLPQVSPNSSPGTKVFLGQFQCPVVSDQGLIISFSVPETIPPGKYLLKMEARGMQTNTNDSIEVLRGKWRQINSPNIPINPAASASGLILFGTCYSQNKGYMIGGSYFNGPQVSWPNSMYPEYIFEFDGMLQTWTKRNTTNRRYFNDPICYYFNNAIYVIGGKEIRIDQWGNIHNVILKKMMRLDLGNLTWSDLNDLPYSTMINVSSFEINNEWYIGMGADSANQTICCGMPIPSRKFWKYNPVNNQWTQLSDYPGDYQNVPTCFSIGLKGYAFYGAIPVGNPTIATNFTQQLWEYNPNTNSWSNIQLPSLGGPPPGEKYQIVTTNEKAYFLSGQKLNLFGGGYGYTGVDPCLEWNPSTNTFSKISFPTNGYSPIVKNIFKQGNSFYFQSDAFGYYESIPNKTHLLTVE